MMRSGLRATLVALVAGTGLAWAGAAAAGPLAPATAEAAAKAAPVAAAPVTWVCGPSRCDWRPGVPGARVVVPRYAAGWGAPRHPWCYWSKVRSPYGGWRWVQVCRH